MRESQDPKSETIVLPNPVLYTPPIHEVTPPSPHTYVYREKLMDTEARPEQARKTLVSTSHVDSQCDTTKYPVAETQTTNREQVVMVTNIGNHRSICKSPLEISKNITTAHYSTSYENEHSTNKNTAERRSENIPFEKNQNSEISKIEYMIHQLLHQKGNDNFHSDIESQNVSKQFNKMNTQQVDKNKQQVSESSGQGNTDVRQTQTSPTQEDPERQSKKTRSRRRVKQRHKRKDQSETNWSEDVKDYKGYKPIDELVKFITG